jgi:O-glycosyl hydrolase
MIAQLAISLAAATTPLEALDLSRWQQGFSRPRIGQAVTHRPLIINKRRFEKGLGTHSPALARYGLGGRATRIAGAVGMADTSSGKAQFAIWSGGKQLWESPILKAGQDPVPFDLNISGAAELALVVNDGKDGSGGDHACWLGVTFTHTGPPPSSLPAMRTLRPLLDRPRQTIDNFAASDSWTVEPLIHWPESKRKEIARLLFDRTRGIGLSGWRHNLGGGLSHETISNPLRTADTYDAGEGKFDFSRCPGQRWMLEAAKNHGVERFVAYSITPPRRMTRSGFTTGNDGDGSTNLRDGEEGAYARYLAGVVEHFRGQGYPFTHLSPINEPDYEWNAGSQEGSRASNKDIVRITQAISDELRRRNLPVRVLTPEASSPQRGYELNAGMEKKYGAPYGAYAAMLHQDPAWRKSVNPVFAYHSYWADSLQSMHPTRVRLKQELDKAPGTEAWMTEYCQMSGPRGEGGWGRDIGMTLALNLARLIHLDLTVVEASAWQWWLGVSDSDYKDGLVYVDDLERPEGSIFASKALWALGNFSRFVRPGFRRIEVEGAFEDIGGVLPTAFQDPRSGRLVIVFVNTEPQSAEIMLELEGQWKTGAYITSDRAGHDLAPHPSRLGKPLALPSRSVVTLVLDPIR